MTEALNAIAAQATERKGARVFVVLNPMGGSCDPQAIRDALERHFGAAGASLDIYETTGAEDEDIPALARAAHERGCDMVVAAGGDGTISSVAAGLAGSETPLGIIPAGTANVFAREIGVPVELDAAAMLLAGEHVTVPVDALVVNGQAYVLAVSVGIESLMIRDTPREAKRRFGRAAYLWTAVSRAVGFQQPRFTLIVDGKRLRPRALQVLIANGGTLGVKPLRWGPEISPSDGRANVIIVSTRTPLDYLKIGWDVLRGRQRRNPGLRYLKASESVSVAVDSPLPIQADGEIIGETPLQVKISPAALRVVVPRAGG
jgi:YegS/Rv2252/BmrU family lipid kinase